MKKRRRDFKKKFAESTITFLIFRTAPRGFCCVLAMPWRTQFSTLEGVLPSEVLASIGLTRVAGHGHGQVPARSVWIGHQIPVPATVWR